MRFTVVAFAVLAAFFIAAPAFRAYMEPPS
jgi:hypothetical protein